MKEKFKIFFIMPFDPDFNDLYSHMKEMIEDEDEIFEVFRADNLLHQQNILKDIVLAINDSDLIIADLTDLNANVFYELGLAHALRKDVVLLTQQLDEIPFDLRSYRIISYSTNFKKIQELNSNLKRILNEIKNGQLSFGSPITDWLPSSDLNKESYVFPFREEAINSEGEIEDEGFLDYMANLEDSMENLFVIVTEFGLTTTQMSEALTEKTVEIEVVSQNKGNGTASRMRKVARKTSTILNDFGLSVVKYNKDYEENWIVFEESINNLFNSNIIQQEIDGDSKDFEEFLTTLESFKNNIYPAREALESFLTSLSSLRGIESSINKAVTLVDRELQEFIDLLNTSVATTERLSLKGLDILTKKINTIKM